MNLRQLGLTLGKNLSAPGRFELTEALFLRVLGLIYLSSFASWWPQIIGLAGTHGVVSAASTLAVVHREFGPRAFYYIPSLFWFNMSDASLVSLCVLGCCAALLLTCGIFSRWSAIGCFALYLSIISIAQPFSSFQWDALLLEAGFLAIFTGAPWLGWAYRLLLFRLMIESGIVKLSSGDPNWRDLHALRFHFMTQPLPNPVAYYVHHFPAWVLDSATAATLFIELAAPVMLFLPRRVRLTGASLLMLLQIIILLTGNYAFFNLLSLALCLWALDDSAFASISGMLAWRYPKWPVWGNVLRWRVLGNATVAIVMTLGIAQLIELLTPSIRTLSGPALAAVAPFEIVNSYGLFAVMTTTRDEIVLEGSNDQIDWREYSFPYKPGNTHRPLPWIAPYQPRLDWQMWFAALGNYDGNTWVGGLIYRLMTGEASVLGLLNPAPFSAPPRYMRAVLYEYRFTEPAERSRTGAIWKREMKGLWFGPVSITRR